MERTALLNGAIKDVDSLVKLQYMDDEIELATSLVLVVSSHSLDMSCLCIILDLNGILMATNFEIVCKMGVCSQNQKPFTLFWTFLLRLELKEFLKRSMA